MSSFNRVILMGRLTQDIELRTTSGGHSVVDVGLAVNERRLSKGGEWKEQVQYIDVTFWNRKAEVIAEYFSKGSPILIEGKLQLERWEKDEKTFSKLKVRGEQFSFVGSKSQTQSGAKSSSGDEALAGIGSENDIPF
ncbi:MAG: single-stranded DNA-binding protein [Planctomycetota bacterium]|nr:single-stranded DNA-binding protein [Planctomycetota bacterium]